MWRKRLVFRSRSSRGSRQKVRLLDRMCAPPQHNRTEPCWRCWPSKHGSLPRTALSSAKTSATACATICATPLHRWGLGLSVVASPRYGNVLTHEHLRIVAATSLSPPGPARAHGSRRAFDFQSRPRPVAIVSSGPQMVPRRHRQRPQNSSTPCALPRRSPERRSHRGPSNLLGSLLL